jgi:hypothetical protein
VLRPSIQVRAQFANLAPQFLKTVSPDRELMSGLSGLAIPFLEARGVSRGNVERFLVKRRVFPQLTLRASRQRRWHPEGDWLVFRRNRCLSPSARSGFW